MIYRASPRASRGCAWYYDARCTCASLHDFWSSDLRYDGIGLRLVSVS